MKPELEEHALSIVGQLAETPADKRDELRSQLCGNDAELKSAVTELWLDHEAAERNEFWQRPAVERSELLKSPEAAPAEVLRANPASTEVTLVSDPNAAASEVTLVPPPPSSGGAQPAGAAAAPSGQTSSVPPGAPRIGRFDAKELLGVGGQGEVWRATDPHLDRDVALKVVRPGLKGSQPTLAKFKREAEVTGKLEHPCIVPVYEAGAETPDGAPFYVMRILREKSLQVSIDEFHRRDPSPEDYLRGLRGLLDRFIDVCEALGYAHSRGVIHRDLKPVNVMLGDFGETLVVDWGWRRSRDGTNCTVRKRVKGRCGSTRTTRRRATVRSSARRATCLPNRRGVRSPNSNPPPTSTVWEPSCSRS